MKITQIRPLGLTGDEAAPPRGEPGTPQRARHIAHAVAAHHNRAVGPAQAEEDAYGRLTAARAEANAAWEALSLPETTNWPAAHHRWIRAEDHLNQAAREWKTAADDYQEAARPIFGDEKYDAYWTIAAQAGVARLLGPHRPETPSMVVYDLEQRLRDRKRLTAETLRHLKH